MVIEPLLHLLPDSDISQETTKTDAIPVHVQLIYESFMQYEKGISFAV